MVFLGKCKFCGTGLRNNRLPRATINSQAGENLTSNYLETPLIYVHLQEVRVWDEGEGIGCEGMGCEGEGIGCEGMGCEGEGMGCEGEGMG